VSRAADLRRDVRDGLWSRPGRTALAFAGVALGLFALTLTLGVLRGVRLRSQRLAAELGAHAAALVQPAAPAAPERRLRRNRGDVLRAAVPGIRWSGVRERVVRLADRHSLRLVRTDESLAGVRGWVAAEGRFLDGADVRDGERHAVATASAARRLGWSVGDAIGLEGRVFRVVGILAGGAAAGDAAPGIVSAGESALFVPWTACPPEAPFEPADALDALYVRAADEASLRRLLEVSPRALAAPDAAVADASWITPDVLLAGLRRWRNGLAWGTGSIAVLALLLGGTSLMSLLLSDVRNRVPEIGLRLSLGATPLDIAMLFLSEAWLVTLAAAAAALAGAWPLLRLLARQTALPFDLDAGSIAVVAIASFAFGAIFSFLPARLAARTPAAEALRND